MPSGWCRDKESVAVAPADPEVDANLYSRRPMHPRGLPGNHCVTLLFSISLGGQGFLMYPRIAHAARNSVQKEKGDQSSTSKGLKIQLISWLLLPISENCECWRSSMHAASNSGLTCLFKLRQCFSSPLFCFHPPLWISNLNCNSR